MIQGAQKIPSARQSTGNSWRIDGQLSTAKSSITAHSRREGRQSIRDDWVEVEQLILGSPVLSVCPANI
jgi:hypothetical protein